MRFSGVYASIELTRRVATVLRGWAVWWEPEDQWWCVDDDAPDGVRPLTGMEMMTVIRTVLTRTPQDIDTDGEFSFDLWATSFPELVWPEEEAPTAEGIQARTTCLPITPVTRRLDQFAADRAAR